MAPTRVIQDSDDEDETSPSPEKTTAVGQQNTEPPSTDISLGVNFDDFISPTPHEGEQGTLSGKVKDASGTGGSGSTDQLRLELEAVQRGLVEPTPAPHLGGLDGVDEGGGLVSQLSPSMARLKRRRTMGGLSADGKESGEFGPKKRKRLRTYAERVRGPLSQEEVFREIRGEGPDGGDLDNKNEGNAVGGGLDFSSRHDGSRDTEEIPSGDLDQRTEQPVNNPNELRAVEEDDEDEDAVTNKRSRRTQSSFGVTRPMSTTQSTIGSYQGINIDYRGTGLMVDIGSREGLTESQRDQYEEFGVDPRQIQRYPAEEDLNMEDLLMKQGLESSTLPDTSLIEEQAERFDISNETSRGELPDNSLPSASSPSFACRKRTPGRSKSMLLNTESPHDMHPASSAKSKKKRRTMTVMDPSSQPTPAATPDELALPDAVQKAISKKAKPGRKRKRAVEEPEEMREDELKSDKLGISLPKEQYKPRPSRSRSKRDDIIDAEGTPIERTHHETEDDELATPLSKEQRDPRLNRSRTKEFQNEEPTATSPEKPPSSQLNPDEVAIGLPKEQYKPRPSRSRGKPDEALAALDFEKKPRKETKKKIKRAKTSGLVLKKTVESDVEDDVIWVDEKPLDVNFKVPPPLQVKSEYTVANQKAAILDEEKEPEDPDAISPESEVEVEKPKPAQTKPEPKKRGRKPKKPVEAPHIAEEEELVVPGVDKEDSNKTNIPIPDKTQAPFNEKDPNQISKSQPIEIPPLNPGKTKDDTDTPDDIAKENTPPSSPSAAADSAAAPPVETPKKQQQQHTAKGPEKHSPISVTGTVPYRVGLSRRARIQPLLRVVRK